MRDLRRASCLSQQLYRGSTPRGYDSKQRVGDRIARYSNNRLTVLKDTTENRIWGFSESVQVNWASKQVNVQVGSFVHLPLISRGAHHLKSVDGQSPSSFPTPPLPIASTFLKPLKSVLCIRQFLDYIMNKAQTRGKKDRAQGGRNMTKA